MKTILLAVALCAVSATASAVDGVIEINHARALAGGITPGDDPGYPVTLSHSSSYRLTGNLTLPGANTSGITSIADNVSLDLNGFAVIGPNVCVYNAGVTCSETGLADGITLTGDNASVRNGIVRGVTGDGIEVGNASVVDGVRVSHVGLVGVKQNGEGGVVRNSVVSLVKMVGIQATDRGLIHANALDNIGDTAIQLSGTDNLVIDNVAVGYTNAIACPGASSGFGNNLLRAFVTTVNANCATADMGNNKIW